MPREQTRWKPGLSMYLITKLPTGHNCWRLRLVMYPFLYFTMHRDQPCWRLQLFNYAEYFNNNDYDYDYDYYYYYYHYYCYYYYCYKQSRVDAPAGQADQPRPR